MRATMRRNVSSGLALITWTMCASLLGCAPGSARPSFSPPPPGPAVPLPAALPSVDRTFALPLGKDEVSLDLHPRVELHESVAADSDERSALAAAVVLTLPRSRVALRHVDVRLDIKRHPGGQVTQTREVSYSRDTREEALTVALGPLGDGTYDIDVHSLARVDVLDEDWSVMVDTREATEHAPLVVGAEAGKREQSKAFELHFDNDSAVPVATEARALDGTVKAIGALLAAHPGATARVDCWTSSTGEERLNRALAGRRCDWFKAEVWSHLAHTTTDPLASVAHGSSELAAEDRSRDVKVQSRNRVVRLRVRWAE